MGAQGMMAVTKDGLNFKLDTESIDVVDVTGAGDTVISHLAIGIMRGFSIKESMTQANKAAGVAVSRLGTTPVTLGHLRFKEESISSVRKRGV